MKEIKTHHEDKEDSPRRGRFTTKTKTKIHHGGTEVTEEKRGGKDVRRIGE